MEDLRLRHYTESKRTAAPGAISAVLHCIRMLTAIATRITRRPYTHAFRAAFGLVGLVTLACLAVTARLRGPHGTGRAISAAMPASLKVPAAASPGDFRTAQPRV